MRISRLVLPALLTLLGLAVWSAVAHPWAWLYAIGLHPYPASSGTPWTYQLWSGFMPALTVLTLLGSVATLYHLHKCHFSQGSRAFLHFHEDAGDLYVDVRFSSEFRRMKVTSRSEQATFLSQVREALQPTS